MNVKKFLTYPISSMRKSEKEHTSQLTKNTAVKEWDIEIACIYGIVLKSLKKLTHCLGQQ